MKRILFLLIVIFLIFFIGKLYCATQTLEGLIEWQGNTGIFKKSVTVYDIPGIGWYTFQKGSKITVGDE